MMSLNTEWTRVVDLLQFPFMQRAILGGILSGLMGGLLGSLTVLRQLSFFSNALGHSALLGISFGFLWGINPAWTLLPFAIVFVGVVIYLQERTQLWTDALLNILHSACLAIALIILGTLDDYKGGINTLLFGDILALQSADLILSGLLLIACVLFIILTLRTQMLITLHEPLAIARGIDVSTHRAVFMVLLALVVGGSIKAIGAMLVSAFIVIPACAARLISRNFTMYMGLSTLLGAGTALMGILLSAALNLPSGPSIVVTQVVCFGLAALMPRSIKAL